MTGYINTIRRRYASLRKNGGPALEAFLWESFKYPRTNEENAVIPRGTVPAEIRGVGDDETLRQQNISLASELSETKGQLTNANQRVRQVVNQGRAAKRKASAYDAMRKRHKAANEQTKYWRKRAARIENAQYMEASHRAQELETQNKSLERQLDLLETQNEELKQSLTDALTDKVCARVCMCVCARAFGGEREREREREREKVRFFIVGNFDG